LSERQTERDGNSEEVVKTLRRCLLWRKGGCLLRDQSRAKKQSGFDYASRDDSFWNRTTNRRKPEEILKNIQTPKRRFQILILRVVFYSLDVGGIFLPSQV
jgi:succinate dehydrogenase/fumarate reductase flavoprotein subunit